MQSHVLQPSTITRTLNNEISAREIHTVFLGPFGLRQGRLMEGYGFRI